MFRSRIYNEKAEEPSDMALQHAGSFALSATWCLSRNFRGQLRSNFILERVAHAFYAMQGKGPGFRGEVRRSRCRRAA